MSRGGNRTYRQIALDDWGILMCSSVEGCRRQWKASSHYNGRVDNAGTIHWDRADVRPRKAGLYAFLKLVGMVFHDREWEKLPRWRRLYEQARWAQTAGHRYGTRFGVADTARDRARVLKASRRAVPGPRTTDQMAYFWIRAVYTGGARKKHPQR